MRRKKINSLDEGERVAGCIASIEWYCASDIISLPRRKETNSRRKRRGIKNE